MSFKIKFVYTYCTSCRGYLMRFRNMLKEQLAKQRQHLKHSRIFKNIAFRHTVCLPFATVYAISFRKPEMEEVEPKPANSTRNTVLSVIDTADKLYNDNKVQELYDCLVQYKEMDNDEVLWRLARATTDKGKASNDSNIKKSCIYEAFEYSKKALQLNDNNFACHKWYAILLDEVGGYEGKKVRISNSLTVKKHFLKAVELNPKDATSVHALGIWCFTFADMSWYTHKIAAALFATPPTSTYSEALYYFQLAEEIEPNFFSKNLLMIGKTMVRMKNYKSGKTFLIRARDYPVITPDDQEAHKEAIQLLKTLGMKEE